MIRILVAPNAPDRTADFIDCAEFVAETPADRARLRRSDADDVAAVIEPSGMSVKRSSGHGKAARYPFRFRRVTKAGVGE